MDQYYLPQLYKPAEQAPEPSPQPGPQRQQQHAESPARKALFEFSTPFDALASASGPPPTQSQVKKKPVPEISPAPRPDQVWNDPKRKSVEDIMDQLTRGQAPFPQNTQQIAPESQTVPYPSYSGEESYQVDQFQQYGRPLPVPKQSVTSPRSSPPKPQPFQQAPPRQNPRRNNDSPLDQHTAERQREKESSPIPRGGNWKGQESGRRSKQKSPQYVFSALFFLADQSLTNPTAFKPSQSSSMWRHRWMRSRPLVTLSSLPLSPSSRSIQTSCPARPSVLLIGLLTP